MPSINIYVSDKDYVVIKRLRRKMSNEGMSFSKLVVRLILQVAKFTS